MVVIKIPEEINKYKEKVVFGLTARQLVCVILALVLAVPTYLNTRSIVGEDIAQYLIMIVGSPFIIIGFFTKNGMTFEKYLWTIIKFHIGYSKVRTIDSKNFWEEIVEEAEEEELKINKVRSNIGKRKDTK